MSEGPDVRRSGCPKVRMSEGPDVRRSGRPKIYITDTTRWQIVIIFMTDNGNILQPLCPKRSPRPTPWEERLTYLLHRDQCDTFIEWSV